MRAHLLLTFGLALLTSSGLNAQQCPPSNSVSRNQAGKSCYNVFQCQPGEMCCPTRFGRRCVLAYGFTTEATMLGLCSDGRSPIQSCSPGVCPPNYKCENGKCCWNNPYGEPPTTALGVCRDGSSPTGRCINQVCSGNQECYRGWCCRRTSTSTSGLCPDGSISATRCTYGRCPSGQRCQNGWCCFDTLPVTTSPLYGGQKRGTCPPYLTVPGAPVNHRCDTDMECEGSRKCCGTATGRVCLYPEM